MQDGVSPKADIHESSLIGWQRSLDKEAICLYTIAMATEFTEGCLEADHQILSHSTVASRLDNILRLHSLELAGAFRPAISSEGECIIKCQVMQAIQTANEFEAQLEAIEKQTCSRAAITIQGIILLPNAQLKFTGNPCSMISYCRVPTQWHVLV